MRTAQAIRFPALFPTFAARAKRRKPYYGEAVIHSTGNGTIYLAVRLALRYRGQVPTVAQLRNDYGMSRATAYRWRRAFLDALGLH